MAERSGLGPVRAACAAAGSFCLGKHQLPFPRRAEHPLGGTEAWGRPAPQSELGHPGRGPARLLPLRPGFSSPAPASRDFIVVPPPQPRSPGTWGSRGRKDVRGLPGGVGARPPPLPGDSGVQVLMWAEAAGGTSVEGTALPWAVGAQPAVHPKAMPGGRTRPPVSYLWAEAWRPASPAARARWLLGAGAATPFSPLPQPWLPGWGSLLGLALRASSLLSDLLTCPLPAQTSTMPAGPQPPCPGPSLQPPTPLVLRS